MTYRDVKELLAGHGRRSPRCEPVTASVPSIDVDAGLVAAVLTRLASVGYHPHLAVADGVDGAQERAPFDKIIATVALPRVPSAWQAQLNPGGTILMPMDLAAHGRSHSLFEVGRTGCSTGAVPGRQRLLHADARAPVSEDQVRSGRGQCARHHTVG